MKKFKLVVDVQGLSIGGSVKDYLPKYNGTDVFKTELEAYKIALTLDRALCKVNAEARFRIKSIDL